MQEVKKKNSQVPTQTAKEMILAVMVVGRVRVVIAQVKGRFAAVSGMLNALASRSWMCPSCFKQNDSAYIACSRCGKGVCWSSGLQSVDCSDCRMPTSLGSYVPLANPQGCGSCNGKGVIMWACGHGINGYHVYCEHNYTGVEHNLS